MILIAIICMAIACVALAVAVCFVKNKTMRLLLNIFFYMAILCFGFTCANFKDQFSGYSILIILSVAPLLLSLFDFEAYLAEKQTKLTKIEQEETDLIENVEDSSTSDGKKKIKKHYFQNSNGTILKGVMFLLPSVCIGFAGFYIGLETAYGFLIGLALSLAGLFLLLILKKKVNPFDLFGYFLIFLAIGIGVGQIVTVLLYAQTITNIFYCAGTLLFCAYVGISTFLKTKYDHLLYLLAISMLFLTFIL